MTSARRTTCCKRSGASLPGSWPLLLLPLLPQAAQWVEAASHPAIMDTTRARTELHWTPEVTALQSLREARWPA